MSTLKERAPQLFETYAVDSGGRPADDPKRPGQLLSAGPRVPSPVEVVSFVFSQHHITPDNGAAIDIVASLDELSKLPKAGPAPGPQPNPPQPAKYLGAERRARAGTSPTGAERRALSAKYIGPERRVKLLPITIPDRRKPAPKV
jgi:hypothetical protein